MERRGQSRRPFSIHTSRSRRERGREEGRHRWDPPQEEGIILKTLSLQVSVCLCILLVCWAVFSGDGKAARWFQDWYRAMASQPAIAWEELGWEEAVQAVADSAGRLWEAVETAATPEARLTGQGGLWPLEGEALPQKAPDGASLSPYFLTAPAQYPVYGQVTCGYGWRFHPITGNPDFHNGMDIAAPQGNSIYAAFPGTVTQRGVSSIYGNYIEVTHAGGLLTVFCHCQELLAPEGAVLRAGERVATVGSTGISTGPHLHFEVLLGETFYDPAPALGFA